MTITLECCYRAPSANVSRRLNRHDNATTACRHPHHDDGRRKQLLEIGAVGPAENDASVTNLVEMVGKDERVDATVMQTVGGKNHDGSLIAVVK